MSMVREIRDLMSRISRVEQQVSKLPSRISSAVGGSGSGGTSKSEIWVEADSYPELPDPEPENITLLGRVIAGDQIDQIYKIATVEPEDEEDDPTLIWSCISEQYEAASKAELVNNSYVQKFAVGRVGSIYYRRNSSNTGWEALNEFE